jgi:hypothetical protein
MILQEVKSPVFELKDDFRNSSFAAISIGILPISRVHRRSPVHQTQGRRFGVHK